MRDQIIAEAARRIGAVPADRVPGLWNIPGHPELTTNQMLQVASAINAGVSGPIERVTGVWQDDQRIF